ncbi:helix-turn-helix domain-containing protein [Paenibacillus lemnae]|uniref:Helix-turn-helix transcriptional regulator n=1 Tax=Paenibacillus lemnae TaxID=1330551 RepID=A0A848MDH0_PAELE|nr:helix-turn-helix domain-containing protein [Paenibacillus lemnae]NMO98133.1 helix-turn-helix transcriptional regulator [Paenibacillus lemnae]
MSKKLGQSFKELKMSAREIPEAREYLDSFSVVVGNLVFARRRALKLSQAELAKLAGTTQAKISNIEAAKQNVTIDTLNGVFSVLGLTQLIPVFNDEQAATHSY